MRDKNMLFKKLMKYYNAGYSMASSISKTGQINLQIDGGHVLAILGIFEWAKEKIYKDETTKIKILRVIKL